MTHHAEQKRSVSPDSWSRRCATRSADVCTNTSYEVAMHVLRLTYDTEYTARVEQLNICNAVEHK